MRTILSLLLAATCTFSTYASSSNLSLQQALSQASSAEQNIFLYFNADWCLPCQIVKEGVLSDSRITKTLDEKYVHVEVDIDDKTKTDWTEGYATSCLPHFFVLDKEGSVLKEISGSLPIEQFYQMLLQFSTSSAPPVVAVEKEIDEAPAFTLIDNVTVTNTVLPAEKSASEPAPTRNKMMNNVPVAVPYQNTRVITIGAFKVESNAMNYIDKMRTAYGFDIYIDMTTGGLYRLNISNFSSKEDFSAQLQRVKENKIDHYLRKV